jgi:hypothetical protein
MNYATRREAISRRDFLASTGTLVTAMALGECRAAQLPVPAAARGQTVSDLAMRWQPAAGAPRHSDVSVSIRWMRPDLDPFAKAAEFHGTRFDWIYATREFIGQCRQRGFPVSHCTSPGRSDPKPAGGGAKATYTVGRAEDIQGRPMRASWQNWNAPWGCYSNPDFFRVMEQDVTFAIDSGATYMHIDDPDTRQMLKWGGDPQDSETRGCFCAHCLERFRVHLGGLSMDELQALGVSDPATFDYRKFIRDGRRQAGLRKRYEECFARTVRMFLENLRRSADHKAGRRFPFACNNGSYTQWAPPIDVFDFAVGELSHYDPPSPASLWKKALTITRLNKAQVWTLRETEVGEIRRVLCLAYCLGQNFVAPWDVWLKGSDRFYGDPRDYREYFAFVRANAAWLDGYEYAAAIGPGIRDGWYGERPPILLEGNEAACAFVRAVPGGGSKPVVVHLFDSGKVAQPFRLTLDHARFFPGKQLACSLLTPVQLGDADHARAEATKDFSSFTRRVKLTGETKGTNTQIEIPALGSWAMLVVSPEPAAP